MEKPHNDSRSAGLEPANRGSADDSRIAHEIVDPIDAACTILHEAEGLLSLENRQNAQIAHGKVRIAIEILQGCTAREGQQGR